MGQIRFYTFNKETLLPEPVSFKPLRYVILAIILGFVVKYVYLYGGIKETTDKYRLEQQYIKEEKAFYERR